MKAVILAGGQGTRIMERTQTIPKPLLEVAGVPLIQHIINIYRGYGVDEIIIAGGYMIGEIQQYFVKMMFEVSHPDDRKTYRFSDDRHEWVFDFSTHIIRVVNTGDKTLTGSRLKRLQSYLDPIQPFFMTYGDGLSDVDLDKVLALHMRTKATATMTIVRPDGRFGRVIANKVYGNVIKFGEKIETETEWVNGGFMVMDPSIFDFINPVDEDINLEKDVFPRLVFENRLYAHYHMGFWKCVDTLRDLLDLEDTVKKEGELWLK